MVLMDLDSTNSAAEQVKKIVKSFEKKEVEDRVMEKKRQRDKKMRAAGKKKTK